MQYWDNPFVLAIAFAVVIMLITITSLTIAGKMGKRTLQTYNRGRTKSEKTIYMFATFGVLSMLIVGLFIVAFLDFVRIPYLDIQFNLDFIAHNIAYFAIGVVLFVLIIIYSLIYSHQKGTLLPSMIRKETVERS
jgi:uncharacterized protein YacL